MLDQDLSVTGELFGTAPEPQSSAGPQLSPYNKGRDSTVTQNKLGLASVRWIDDLLQLHRNHFTISIPRVIRRLVSSRLQQPKVSTFQRVMITSSDIVNRMGYNSQIQLTATNHPGPSSLLGYPSNTSLDHHSSVCQCSLPAALAVRLAFTIALGLPVYIDLSRYMTQC